MEPLTSWYRRAVKQLNLYLLSYNKLPLEQRLPRLLLAFVLLFVLVRRTRAAKPAQVASVRKQVVWLSFSHFLDSVDRGEVKQVLFGDDEVLKVALTTAKENEVYLTRRLPSHLMPLLTQLRSKGVQFDLSSISELSHESTPLWQSVLIVLLPVAYVSALGYILYRVFGSNIGANNVGSRGDKHHKRMTKFEDIAGADSAKEAVREVCDILKNQDKYSTAGARLPSGILLVGPPGTGKTMLARAMADDAGLPFFYCSGSDFVEVYSGRGAARVRSLFAKAARAAPSVVFIDEIDALGGSRHSGPTNNEEREQTLNQLLACMDGFDSEQNVIVMGATNRYEYLDKALVRPGRFDRVVRLSLPDLIGRSNILRVHTKGMMLDEDVDLIEIASACEGMSGAELSALANEAAIHSVRQGRQLLEQSDFQVVLDKFQKSRSPPPKADQFAEGGGGLREFIRRMNLSQDLD